MQTLSANRVIWPYSHQCHIHSDYCIIVSLPNASLRGHPQKYETNNQRLDEMCEFSEMSMDINNSLCRDATIVYKTHMPFCHNNERRNYSLLAYSSLSPPPRYYYTGKASQLC